MSYRPGLWLIAVVIVHALGLAEKLSTFVAKNFYIRGCRMIYNKVNYSTTYDSLNSSEEPQAWPHCRDGNFWTWTCKVCDNCYSKKELWRNTETEILNCFRYFLEEYEEPWKIICLVLWWKAFKKFGYVNFVINHLFEIVSWKTTSFVTTEFQRCKKRQVWQERLC